MLTNILFALGFFVLLKGASMLVDGASSLSKKFGISSLVIGLTVVAFGTSTPELLVSLLASFQGSTDIAIGNIIGSNIANVLLVLGATAIVYPIAIKENTAWKEIPFSFLAALAVLFLANDVFISKSQANVITRIDGLVLLSFFVIFLYYIFGVAKKANTNVEARIENIGIYRSLFLVLIGFVGLTLGGKWVVDGAVKMASHVGLSEAFIGLTVIAIGTSLPELVTSVVAALKKDVDIAIGNAIGSSIFNIFWILGLSAVIKPLPFNTINNLDTLVLVAASALLFLTLFTGKRHHIDKWEGVLFLIAYFAYLGFLIFRG